MIFFLKSSIAVPSLLAFLLLLASGVEDDSFEELPQSEALIKFEREEQEYYASLGQKGQMDEKCDVHYNSENGKCAWWNDGDKKYERPALEQTKNLDGIDCVATLRNHMITHVCGDPLYEQVKYCAQVKFFNNMAPEDGGISEQTKNMLLLLIDGCILCSGDNEGCSEDRLISAKFTISYTLPEGSFFTGCSEDIFDIELFSTSFLYNASITNGTAGRTEEMFDGMFFDSTSKIGQTTFAYPVTLAERRCSVFFGLFGHDEFRGGFNDVTLKVEHNCNVNKPNKPIIHKMTLNISDFKDNISELRRLQIDLGNGLVTQFQMSSGREEGQIQFENYLIKYENTEDF